MVFTMTSTSLFLLISFIICYFQLNWINQFIYIYRMDWFATRQQHKEATFHSDPWTTSSSVYGIMLCFGFILFLFGIGCLKSSIVAILYKLNNTLSFNLSFKKQISLNNAIGNFAKTLWMALKVRLCPPKPMKNVETE